MKAASGGLGSRGHGRPTQATVAAAAGVTSMTVSRFLRAPHAVAPATAARIEAALADTDYAAIARGFGCYGEVVTLAEDVAGAISRALASGLPAVLDCHTQFLPHPAMPLFGSMNRYGFDAITGIQTGR